MGPRSSVLGPMTAQQMQPPYFNLPKNNLKEILRLPAGGKPCNSLSSSGRPRGRTVARTNRQAIGAASVGEDGPLAAQKAAGETSMAELRAAMWRRMQANAATQMPLVLRHLRAGPQVVTNGGKDLGHLRIGTGGMHGGMPPMAVRDLLPGRDLRGALQPGRTRRLLHDQVRRLLHLNLGWTVGGPPLSPEDQTAAKGLRRGSSYRPSLGRVMAASSETPPGVTFDRWQRGSA